MPRDEEQVICKQLDLVLGGETVTVDVRSIRQNREFRRKLGEMLSAGQGDDPIASILDSGVDALMDLPALYAPEIADKCGAASDEELITAGRMVIEVVSPFVRAVIESMTALADRMTATG